MLGLIWDEQFIFYGDILNSLLTHLFFQMSNDYFKTYIQHVLLILKLITENILKANMNH